jgi:hypothetical protein
VAAAGVAVYGCSLRAHVALPVLLLLQLLLVEHQLPLCLSLQDVALFQLMSLVGLLVSASS